MAQTKQSSLPVTEKPIESFKNPLGRPTKFKPEYTQQLIEFFSRPFTETEEVEATTEIGTKGDKFTTKRRRIPANFPSLLMFAREIDVSYRTVMRWAKGDLLPTDEVSQDDIDAFCHTAKEVAKEMQTQFLVDNGNKGYAQPSMAIFLLKNIAGMTDKVDMTTGGEKLNSLIEQTKGEYE